jgi:transcriptional regulator of acetoin/glycerol metabolism
MLKELVGNLTLYLDKEKKRPLVETTKPAAMSKTQVAQELGIARSTLYITNPN